MLAFSTLIRHSDGTYTWSPSALNKLPPELIDIKRMTDYKQISRPGWSSHEMGYRNFAVQTETGELYVFPALIISSEKPPTRRFQGYNTSFTKDQVENYAKQLVEFSESHHEKITSEFNLLVHDLRRLSAAIYHSSQEAIDLIAPIENLHLSLRDAKIRIENVIGAQSILKIRTDVLDYSGNPGVFDEDQNVPLYRRSDKVIRSFTAFAAKKNIRFHKSGSSFSEAKGPNAFEIIPYALLDNAIKYSPYNNDISISFRETSGNFEMSVTSVGPKIDISETSDIFQKGFRGKFARTAGLPGSGIGLFLAKKLVERFRGSISVVTSGEYIIDQQEMADITFRVEIPLITVSHRGNGWPRS